MVHQFEYDPVLVLLSFGAAILASYVALDLTRNLAIAEGRSRKLWLLAGSVVMGFGIWSMHFIGMLAMHTPGHQVGYEINLLAISIIVPIMASALAFSALTKDQMTSANLIWRGFAMALAIAGMHYTGMYSMVMPFTIKWDFYWVAGSVIIALFASFAALLVFMKIRKEMPSFRLQLFASVLLGIAISGMHYAAMEAAEFLPSTAPLTTNFVVVSDTLALLVTVVTALLLGVALVGAIVQRTLNFRLKDAEESRRLYHESEKNLSKVRAENEERFQLLVESIKDHAIFMVGPTGLIETWNYGAEKLQGYSSEEILGQPISKFYLDYDQGQNKSDVDLTEARILGSHQDEGWKIRKDGTRFWASVIVTALRNKEDRLIGFSVVFRDLSERKKAEEEILTRESQLKEAQSMAQVGSWEWNIVKDEISWSDELYRIYDVDPANFKSSYQQYLERMPEDLRQLIQSKVQKCLETGEEFSFEHQLKHSDGSQHFVHSRGRAIRDDSGAIIKLRGTAQDITERKLIERKLMEAQTQLEKRVEQRTAQLHESLEREKRATEAKMQFLANMSHEIRTPMNAIIGFSELLEDTTLTEEQRGFISRIKTNSGHLLRLIDDILDLSKFEAGRIPVEKARTSLSDLLEDVLQSFAFQAEKKGLGLRTVFKTPVPQYIETDGMRLRQILNNLLGNALKFSRDGLIELQLTYLEFGDSQKPTLILDVEDKGIGISVDDQKKLFQPFSQADSSVARRFGGTGLGLALSRRIAEALGGNLVLKSSDPGKGSCFRLLLLLNNLKSPMMSQLKTTSTAQLKDPENSPLSLDKARVLLAEDSVDNEILIRNFLQPTNIKVDVANNGLQAVEMALRGNYDCILMDIQMPQLDGLEATKRLRAQGFEKPIIALTAHALQEEVDRSLAAGCNFHLTKPINRKLLLETIRIQIQGLN